MWQRWGANPRPVTSQLMQFTELDQDYGCEDRYLETIPEVESISSRRQSTHVVLPELPFRQVPPMVNIPQPVNLHSARSPSRTFSNQHDLRLNVHVPTQEPVPAEISPLTSQDLSIQKPLQDERPVSPIESFMHPASRLPVSGRPLPSQIPRKKLKSGENNLQNPTKWDDYSGEPTSDEKGKPASVRPGTQTLEMQYPHLKERTKQILAGLRERDAARNTRLGKTTAPVAEEALLEQTHREPWRGASGRLPIVEPVRSMPTAKQDLVHSPLHLHTASEAEDPRPQQVHPLTAPCETPRLRSVPSEEEILPVPPLKPGKRIRTPRLVTEPLESSRPKQSPDASPEPLLTYHEVTVETPRYRTESPQPDEEPTTPTTPVIVETPRTIDKPVTPTAYGSHDLDREQSRFSWTTYTTSAADSSPQSVARIIQGSPLPPIPDLPTAITIKKRPVSSSPLTYSSPYGNRNHADSMTSVLRKPLPGVNPRSSSISSATSRAVSTSKSLPPTPTVLEASDKIENFNAQLEALERRKHNINRIISDLQASLKKNAIVYDMWKRREVEKNITNHKMELDDVVRDIHDINLVLTRAQRKRDREDGYEACTGLWIKRVTS